MLIGSGIRGRHTDHHGHEANSLHIPVSPCSRLGSLVGGSQLRPVRASVVEAMAGGAVRAATGPVAVSLDAEQVGEDVGGRRRVLHRAVSLFCEVDPAQAPRPDPAEHPVTGSVGTAPLVGWRRRAPFDRLAQRIDEGVDGLPEAP